LRGTGKLFLENSGPGAEHRRDGQNRPRTRTFILATKEIEKAEGRDGKSISFCWRYNGGEEKPLTKSRKSEGGKE